MSSLIPLSATNPAAIMRPLVLRTCPATGVVNVYRASEPHLAIGTILARRGARPYSWWCHTALGGVGRGEADDIESAHRLLIAELERTTPPTRH